MASKHFAKCYLWLLVDVSACSGLLTFSSVNIQINLIKLYLINLNKFFDDVQSLRFDIDSFFPCVTDN